MREHAIIPDYEPGISDDVTLMELGFTGREIDMEITLEMKGRLHMQNHAVAKAKEAVMREMEEKRKQADTGRTGRPLTRGRTAAIHRRKG